MTNATVSLVITCYNQAAFIAEAINSGLRQTLSPTEIIVVDDGSPDDTAGIVAAFGERVRYIKQANAGVVVARTRGITEATGEFVVLLDGDDRLLPTAFEREVAALTDKPHCAFVSAQCHTINGDGSLYATPQQTPLSTNIYAALLMNNFIWMPAQVMFRRRQLIESGGLNAQADHASDYEIYLRLSRRYGAVAINEPVAEWRLHGGNTHHKLAMMMNSCFKVFRAQKRFVGESRELQTAYQYGLRRWREFYGEQVLQQLREELRRPTHNRKLIMKNALTLTKHAPLFFGKHVARKMYCIAFGIKSDLAIND